MNQPTNKKPKGDFIYIYQNKRFCSEYDYDNKGVLQIENHSVTPAVGFFFSKKTP